LSLRLSPPLKVPDTPALHSTFACRRPPSCSLVERRSDGFAPLRQLRLVDPPMRSRAPSSSAVSLPARRDESNLEACAGAWSWCHWAGRRPYSPEYTPRASTARG
jgi:hypothetical protein